jgi:hypothetical protein
LAQFAQSPAFRDPVGFLNKLIVLPVLLNGVMGGDARIAQAICSKTTDMRAIRNDSDSISEGRGLGCVVVKESMKESMIEANVIDLRIV